MKSKNKLNIELLEEYDRVSFYSIHFDGDTFSEFEKFLSTNKGNFPRDIATILSRISKIGENGAFERYFRYAGKRKDRTAELPSNIDTSKLRLYCIRISEQIVILGNGGAKTTRTYNEDKFLNACVNKLKKIDYFIKSKEQNQEILIEDKILKGNLTLYI